MRFLLGAAVLLLNLADNATTFLCLRAPAEHYVVFEANPVARWLFEGVGLVEGLALEMVLSTVAVAFLVLTTRIKAPTRLVLLGVLAALPAWAVANNMQVMYEVGIGVPPW